MSPTQSSSRSESLVREMGRVAIDFYTELKAVYIDYTSRLS